MTQIDEKILRTAVAVVPQKALLFTGTILENLRWGREDASLEEVRCVAKIACADSFVSEMENGYDTLLSQGGVNLSGGQKRRVAIAGVLAMKPEVLILDEPTAGLDPAGRDEILDLVARMHRERNMTVILVSHSMEDVAKYVERIIVMNHGQVMFDGIPKEVFRHYKELETIGLAAPQVTYLMHELKEHGLSVDTEATTVEEARASLMQALTGIDSGRSDIHR